MGRKKFRWWMPLVPVLLAVALLTMVFWDSVLIRVAPKAVLTAAVSDTFSKLEERFREDPLLILVKAIEPEGKYTVDINLNTNGKLLGPIGYDMKVQTNCNNHQFFAEGSAATSDTQFDLAWYMDSDFMAVSSNDLVKGSYYGISYDTFSEDIRSIPLLNFFVSDKMIAQWEASIQNVQKLVSRSYAMPQMPEISVENMQALLLGILALPCEIENSSVSADASYLDCQALSYQASGEQVDKFLADTPYSEGAVITVTFYLYKNALIKVQLNCVSGSQSVLYSLDLGLNPSNDVLRLKGTQNSSGVLDNFMLTVETKRTEDHYAESWNFSKTAGWRFSELTERETVNKTLSFDYQYSNTNLDITFSELDEPVSTIFYETENGFRMETDDFAPLMQLFLMQGSAEKSKLDQISCTLTLCKGSEIKMPAYKNLDQWSLEDFWTLLSGVGSLIGIQVVS